VRGESRPPAGWEGIAGAPEAGRRPTSVPDYRPSAARGRLLASPSHPLTGKGRGAALRYPRIFGTETADGSPG
jgi:hypothetical protein